MLLVPRAENLEDSVLVCSPATLLRLGAMAKARWLSSEWRRGARARRRQRVNRDGASDDAKIKKGAKTRAKSFRQVQRSRGAGEQGGLGGHLGCQTRARQRNAKHDTDRTHRHNAKCLLHYSIMRGTVHETQSSTVPDCVVAGIGLITLMC